MRLLAMRLLAMLFWPCPSSLAESFLALRRALAVSTTFVTPPETAGSGSLVDGMAELQRCT
jgi:hypothetical protein